MKIRKSKVKRKSVNYRMRLILVISVLLIAVDIFISFVVISDVRRKNTQYLENVAKLYIKAQDESFFKLSRQMLSILMGSDGGKSEINQELSVLESSSDPLEINIAKAKLKQDFLEYTWDYGTQYRFFAFLEKCDMYVDLNTQGRDGPDPDMESEVRRLLKEGTLDIYSAKARWSCIEIPSGNYILKVMYNRGRYIGCYLPAEALIEPLASSDITDGNFYTLINEDGQLAAGMGLSEKKLGVLEEYLEKGSIGLFDGYFVIEIPFARAPFKILTFLANQGMYEKYFAIQTALILLGVSILGTLIFIMQYVQRRVLHPIQRFADNLLKYDDPEQFVFDITSSELKELEQANEQFRNLLRQIKRLKITLYENELNKQKIQMDYLQLQIKPHFYLNCLNFIYQMIDLGYGDEAKKMSAVTSDYLRYLFRSNTDFVDIRSELKHVENYLEIQKMRYQDAFTWYIEQDEESMDAVIPPLMIQTFVENSIRHTVSFERSVEITILVFAEEYQGEPSVHITITDSGRGFPPEILDQMNKGGGLLPEDGHRVGITNCIKRMNYFYHGKGVMEFYNSPLGGAVVDIYLPVKR